LVPGAADVILNLQTATGTIYVSVGYDQFVDFSISPLELLSDEQAVGTLSSRYPVGMLATRVVEIA